MMDTIDTGVVAAVRALYASDENAKRFFDWCAEKKRDVTETRVERVMQVIDISRSAAVALARSLEVAGCGEFLVGRRGSPSRFVWSYSRISIGQIAAGEVEELEDVVDPLDEDEEVDVGGQALTIRQAKGMLAESLGVSVDQIEIIVRA
ncbi:hypothetical protein [Rhodobacter capsulatus]|uniref:hypothetical protein n=1 Tax=Rhodobacter capsulatus TaxID=1061 RepID=UPI004027DD64